MSEARDRELEDEARALLRPAKDPLPVSAEVRARMLRRMALAIPIDGGGEPGAPPASPATPLTPPAPTAAPAGAIGRALATRVPAWSLLVSFVAGGAIAVAARGPAPSEGARGPEVVAPPSVSTMAPPSASAPVVAAPASASAPVAAAPTTSASASATAARASAPTTPIASIASPRASADSALEAERALLDVARTALGRGDGVNALRAADEHGRKFPRGILAEEREAMTIQALRLLHRDDEAEARLQRFRGRFPSSLIRPALEAADGGTP